MSKQKNSSTNAILLMHCPDQPGILAVVTDFINVNGGNILYLDQYVDRENHVFFMRVEWDLTNFIIPQNKIEDYFNTLYGQKYDMSFNLYFNDRKPRMAIFVSKMSHCLYDILARYTAGEWNVEIPVIISNHPDLESVAKRFDIDYHIFPVNKENKAEQEAKLNGNAAPVPAPASVDNGSQAEAPVQSQAHDDKPGRAPVKVEQTTVGNIVFKLQILTSDRVLSKNDKRLKGLKGTEYYKEGGLYKYTYGASSSYDEIKRLKRSIAAKFKDAFIVAFENGKKTDVNAAIRKTSKNKAK